MTDIQKRIEAEAHAFAFTISGNPKSFGYGRAYAQAKIYLERGYQLASQWIAIKEGCEMPEEGDQVEVWVKYTDTMVICKFIKGRFINRWDNSIVDATHYKPAPPPPHQ